MLNLIEPLLTNAYIVLGAICEGGKKLNDDILVFIL